MRTVPPGTIAEIDDVSSSTFRPVWSGSAMPMAPGNPDMCGTVIVRANPVNLAVRNDGKTAALETGALLVGSDEHYVFARVRTTRLIGNRDVQELHAIPWGTR